MLTHINTYVIIPNKSTAISVKKRFCAVLFPAKIYRPATHPIILPSVSPDKILRLYCVGGIFFLGKPYLENFMSRPSVIPAFRPTPLQNRGRNLIRGERRTITDTSVHIHTPMPGFENLYPLLNLNFQNLRKKQKASIDPWPQFHKLKLRRTLRSYLLGSAFPKPCSARSA